MSKEAQEIWVERDGTRERVEPEAATVTPDAAFVATVLDGAPNISPGREAEQVVALTEAALRSAEQGRIVEMGRLTAT
jgi:predicted dehydrogenase